VASSGGEVAPVLVPAPNMVLFAVSPDGGTLLVADSVGQTDLGGPLWGVPVLGGSPRRLGDATGQAAAWSPDGQRIVYADGQDLFLANSDGSEPHKLVSAPAEVFNVAWSPDRSAIRFTLGDRRGPRSSLWQVSATGNDPNPLLPGWNPPPSNCCGQWTPDGKYFVFWSKGNIWARAEKGSWFAKANNQPFQLTSGPMSFSWPLPSKDGKKLFVVGALARGELSRYDAKSALFAPFLSGISADSVSFSKDGQWVAFVSVPDGILWRSKLDGSQRIQLTYPPLTPLLPNWSPDGQLIVFSALSPGKKTKIYTVSPSGGTPREIIPENSRDEWDPTWSADGTEIAFGGASDANSGIQIFDLKTNQVSTLPSSKGLFSPRWSPDGRYVAALSSSTRGVMLFDFAAQKWAELAKISMGFPNWSKNSDYLYFFQQENQPSVMRVHIRDRKIETVTDLKNFRITGLLAGDWLGLAPDDSPLLLRDTGTQEIYALDWQTQ